MLPLSPRVDCEREMVTLPKDNQPSLSVGIPIMVSETELLERGVATGEQLRRTKNELSAIFMEPRALAFLRAWPDVPEVLQPAYSRFYDAGLIWSDPNAPQEMGWPGTLRLTAAGHRVREVMIGSNINYFRIEDVFGVIAAEKLIQQDPQTHHFLRLWRCYYKSDAQHAQLMDWNYPDLKRYVSLRTDGKDPGAFGYAAASARLKTAVERLTFHLGMLAWRMGNPDDIDNEIPF